jgi:hypothetical protein
MSYDRRTFLHFDLFLFVLLAFMIDERWFDLPLLRGGDGDLYIAGWEVVPLLDLSGVVLKGRWGWGGGMHCWVDGMVMSIVW